MTQTIDLWQTRARAWTHLQDVRPKRVAIMLDYFELIDRCVDVFNEVANTNTYAQVCGLTLLKAKNLALGSLSLVLDALGQEAGALLRPMIEYVELLTYVRKFPDKAELALKNELPKAGQRAKAIGGMFKEFREHLNENASHSSYSRFALSHLLTPEGKLRKLQQFVPAVLEQNVLDFTVQLHFIAFEGVRGLESLGVPTFHELATVAESIKTRMIKDFELDIQRRRNEASRREV